MVFIVTLARPRTAPLICESRACSASMRAPRSQGSSHLRDENYSFANYSFVVKLSQYTSHYYIEANIENMT